MMEPNDGAHSHLHSWLSDAATLTAMNLRRLETDRCRRWAPRRKTLLCDVSADSNKAPAATSNWVVLIMLISTWIKPFSFSAFCSCVCCISQHSGGRVRLRVGWGRADTQQNTGRHTGLFSVPQCDVEAAAVRSINRSEDKSHLSSRRWTAPDQNRTWWHSRCLFLLKFWICTDSLKQQTLFVFSLRQISCVVSLGVILIAELYRYIFTCRVFNEQVVRWSGCITTSCEDSFFRLNSGLFFSGHRGWTSLSWSFGEFMNFKY